MKKLSKWNFNVFIENFFVDSFNSFNSTLVDFGDEAESVVSNYYRIVDKTPKGKRIKVKIKYKRV